MSLFFRSIFIIKCLVCFVFVAKAQTTIKGRITDAETCKGIPYSSIYYKNANCGCYSDSLGYFTLNCRQVFKDSLTFSCLGYKTQSIDVSNTDLSIKVLVNLYSKKYQLSQVDIKPFKKCLTIGSSRLFHRQSIPVYIGEEVACFIKPTINRSMLKCISFYAAEVCDKNPNVRIKIVDNELNTQQPNKDLLTKQVLIRVKQGRNKVDLTEYSIPVTSDGFYVVFESIAVKGDCFNNETKNDQIDHSYYNVVLGCSSPNKSARGVGIRHISIVNWHFSNRFYPFIQAELCY